MHQVGSFWWRLQVLAGAARVAFSPRPRALMALRPYPPEPFWRRWWHLLKPPPPPPPPRPFIPPPWVVEPDSELGVAVPVRKVLVSNPGVAVALIDCVAYSTGFKISLVVRTKEEMNARAMGFPGPPFVEVSEDQQFRFGLRFADGREEKSSGIHPRGVPEYFIAIQEGREPEAPAGPVISLRGGGGGGKRWDFSYWVWPLPPEGPITISCAWTALWAGAVTAEVDGSAIRRAGESSTKLW